MLRCRTSLPYRWFADYNQSASSLDDGPCASDDITWFSIDPCYIFHPMSPTTGSTLKEMFEWFSMLFGTQMFDRERRGPNEGAPRLDRWEFDLHAGTAAQHSLDDYPQEFEGSRDLGPPVSLWLFGRPRIGNRAGHSVSYRYAFGNKSLVALTTTKWVTANRSSFRVRTQPLKTMAT